MLDDYSVKGLAQRSPLRQAQADATRARIVEAATAVLTARGYAGARIEDVAATAGVAYPTVYKAFGNKRNLLAAALQSAMTGGAEGAVERQNWWLEQLHEPDPARQLRLIARNARRIYDGAGRLLEVARSAAATHEEIDAVWRKISDERLARSRTTARSLARKTTLRAATRQTSLTLWTLTGPEVYVLQVDRAALSPSGYQKWLGETLVAAILPI